MANSFAMTILLIVLGLTGKSAMAAEVGIVHGATLALLYAFSANARSLILSKSATVSAYSVVIWRLLLLLPLAAIAYWLSVNAAGVETFLAIILIARRCVDWLNEIHLSEMERLGLQNVAQRYVLLQSATMLLLLVWLVGDIPFPLLGLSIWALAPLFFSLRFIGQAIGVAAEVMHGGVFAKILPHFGSTAIIGITVYVFRLLILLIAGKEVAGDLYTAFAIGGLTGSVFANALGASIALHEERSGRRYFPPFLRHILNLTLLVGISVFVIANMQLLNLEWTGKSALFWQATGLSMVGGVIMVYAQRVRFSLLQSDEEHDVFGPDVLMNILIIASVPFVFYLLGVEALSFLYLLTSVLAYVFYMSARKGAKENSGALETLVGTNNILRVLIAALLLLPLFFQLNHGVFTDTSLTFNSGGALRELPIPVSVLTCYLGILLLGVYKRAFLSFGFIFLTCVFMMMSAIILTQGQAAEQQAKFILLIQFVLPMIALVLGQVYEPSKLNFQDKTYAKAFIWVLIVIVPLQLFFTWRLGLGYLSPNIGFFSVYQYLQYVPVIFVAAYLIVVFSLWSHRRYKVLILVLFPFMSFYTAASLSIPALGLLFFGLLAFALIRIGKERLPLIIFILSVVLSFLYLHHQKNQPMVSYKFDLVSQLWSANSNMLNSTNVEDEKLFPVLKSSMQYPATQNIVGRVAYWEYYLGEITSSWNSFLLGNVEPPSRTQYPSAHNYYLDFVYNFGVLAFIPMLFLICYTAFMIIRNVRRIVESPDVLVLCLVVYFLLLVDNLLKVGLRQPYPAIFTFFLWGLLLTKLSMLTTEKKHATV
jgi:hypothetical protein